MRQIIPVRSLGGYAIVLGLCSLLVSADENIVFSLKVFGGIDYAHMPLNQMIWGLREFHLFSRVCTFILKNTRILFVVFMYIIISYSVEAQFHNLAKFAVLGANRKQIIYIFSTALVRVIGIAVLLGSFVGTLCSAYIARVYFFSFHLHAYGFHPAFQIKSIAYTCLIAFLSFVVAIVLSLRKFLAINPVKFISGNMRDLSHISLIRIVCGIIIAIYTVWYVVTIHYVNDEDVDNHATRIEILEILSLGLLLPIIFKLVLPVVFRLVGRIFPITATLGGRYFQGAIRRYVGIATPILICLLYSVSWYHGMTGTEQLNQKLFLGNDFPFTAVATGIDPRDTGTLRRYQDVHSIDHRAAATPVREEQRWVDAATQTIPGILEVNPQGFIQTFHARVMAGHITEVHGMNIASTRTSDKLGETLQLISPEGKHYAAHIVALVTSTNLTDSSLIVNYADFPDASTVDHYFGHRNMFDFFHYEIFYSGISPQQLHSIGINTISYYQWVEDRIADMFGQLGGQFYVNSAPIIGICLALIIINSISLSAQSLYIRKVVRMIGGSSWQDLRMFVLQLVTIFVFALVLTPLPLLLNIIPEGSYIYRKYHEHLSLNYPYHQITAIAIILILAACIPLGLKIISSRYKKLEHI